MTEVIEKGRWILPETEPAQLLGKLPELGKVMVILRSGGVTHERIGQVGAAVHDGGDLILSGAAHDAHIDLTLLKSVTYDTSSVMRDKTFPRLDFADAEGVPVVSVVGMEGGQSFAPILEDVRLEAVSPPQDETKAGKSAAEIAEDDVGRTLLEQLCAEGRQVEIRATRDGFRQSWHGRIEGVKPAMGFINVMTPDFHLHLKAGTVASWGKQGDSWQAMNGLGEPIGLLVVAS